jgi:hypothetical protein
MTETSGSDKVQEGYQPKTCTRPAPLEPNGQKGYQPKPSGQPEGKHPPSGGSGVKPPPKKGS